MNFNLVFKNKTIHIPLLQRDYVQGGKESVIVPFVDSLIDQSSPSDLNYIYGYTDSEGCFIPVDGQQRLTTLWLLYLYASAKAQKVDDFRVDFTFLSREFAQDFCERLKTKLPSLLASTTLDKSLDKEIRDQYWFIDSWYNNVTVRNMLNTLKYIHRKCASKNAKELWEFLSSGKCNISFAFLDMSADKGLDDDIYIKMNGRGRKLSEFENLKSWMDEKVSSLSFAEEWKKNMDNAWTDLFWQNRNREQEHPEEIDDEQLFFFYNLLVLYHIQSGELQKTITSIRENKQYLYEELLVLLDLNAKSDDTEVTNSIYEKLLKASNIPLVWFDRLQLMTEEFFKFAINSTRRIVSEANRFNNMNLYIGEDKKEKKKTKPIYQISMCAGSLDRTLPLFYALLSYQEGKTSLFDWMRVIRNLILGTPITKENIARILESIHSYAESCKDNDIYDLLSSHNLSVEDSGFYRSQFEEETFKAKWVVDNKEWAMLFNNIEGTSFCRGTIGFIFNYLPEHRNEQLFKEYSSIIHLIFGKSGVRSNISKYNLQRSLMCFTSHYGFGYRTRDKLKFMSSRKEWHKFLNDSKEFEGQPHNECMRKLITRLYEGLKERVDICNHWEEFDREEFYNDREEFYKAINAVMSSIITNTLENDAIKDWRYFFIKYPSVWSSMRQSMCRWKDDYDIYVLGSTQWRNGNIRELRSFAFWRDVLADRKDNLEEYKSWDKPGFWYDDDTCMFISRKCANNRKVTIDVYYERGKSDQYRFRIFYRPKSNASKDDKENTYLATRNELESIANRESFNYKENNHKYWSGYYSYSDAFSLFKKLVIELGNY